MVMNRLDVGAPQQRMVKKSLVMFVGTSFPHEGRTPTSVPKGNGGKRSQMLLLN